MKEHLQKWYNNWLDEHENTDLLYVNKTGGGEPYLSQVCFVRDELAGNLLWGDVPWKDRPEYELEPDWTKKVGAYVVGEHTSKSVRLPVYLLERPDLGFKMVARYNFYDWNISVQSEKPITAGLQGFVTDYPNEANREKYKDGYDGHGYWGYLYWQGFPDEYKFGPWVENPRQFSTYVGSDYRLYTLLFLLLRNLRG